MASDSFRKLCCHAVSTMVALFSECHLIWCAGKEDSRPMSCWEKRKIFHHQFWPNQSNSNTISSLPAPRLTPSTIQCLTQSVQKSPHSKIPSGFLNVSMFLPFGQKWYSNQTTSDTFSLEQFFTLIARSIESIHLARIELATFSVLSWRHSH